jgi:hypothetical protein
MPNRSSSHVRWALAALVAIAFMVLVIVAWRTSYARVTDNQGKASASNHALTVATTRNSLAAMQDPTTTVATIQRLRAAIESTLYGQLDPGAFLDAALMLAALEPEHDALTIAHPSGAPRHRLLNAPQGVTAELWVRRTVAGNLVLTLDTELEVPLNPYVLEGAARTNLQAQVTVWEDSAGHLAHFGILTELQLAPANRALGLWPTQARVPVGLLYAYDAQHPTQAVVSAYGVDHGAPADWDISAEFSGGEWPRAADLETLNGELLAMHEKL